MVADDNFEQYYAEKIWDLIPAYYRHEDGIAENPDVLRGIVEIIAKQAAHLRRSQDRAWDDQFIELSMEWAVPYIGALVGTRMLPALEKRGARVDVAKTIYYRRRKGTAVVLEELITDITGWSGKLVETFRNLGRTWHRLDPPIGVRTIGLSDTPMGGFADMRSTFGALQTGTAFDSMSSTPDVRRPVGHKGWPNIPVLVFQLYPLEVYKLSNVHAFEKAGAISYTFDPSGRDIPLFAAGNDTFDWSSWKAPQAWDVPYRITCHLLNQARFAVTEADLLDAAADLGLSSGLLDELRLIRDKVYKREVDFLRALQDLPGSATFISSSVYRFLYNKALVSETGRAALLGTSIEIFRGNASRVDNQAIIGGDLSTWSPAAFHDKEVVVDPSRGRFHFLFGNGTESTHTTYCYGISYGLGAGGHDRRHIEEASVDGGPPAGGGPIDNLALLNEGVVEVSDSATYSPVSDKLSVKNLTVQAANRERPYLFLTTHWVLNTGSNNDANVTLDGLWLGCGASEKLILRGNFECVQLKHMTLDPGGKTSADPTATDINPVVLRIGGHIETLIIERSILGQIEFSNRGYVENLVIRDSILQAPQMTDMLVSTKGELHLERVTAYGKIVGQHIFVTDSLVVGTLRAVDNQKGCLRFSGVGLNNKQPHPYECYDLDPDRSLFYSRRFGEPGFFRLRGSLEDQILKGAEDGLEMGAFNRANTGIKLESLKIKVQEYMPFGRLPGFFMNL
jgi:hypothetical protein